MPKKKYLWKKYLRAIDERTGDQLQVRQGAQPRRAARVADGVNEGVPPTEVASAISQPE